MKLTDAFIRNLKFEGAKVKHFDDALPNFGVRVYKSGISFVVMLGNARKMKTIGRYPALSLKEARTEALRLLNGQSVHIPKTPETVISSFLEHCERKNKPRTVKDYRRLLKRFPDSWDRQTILTTLQAFCATPGELSHLTTAFQVFLNWCVHNGIIEQNPIAGLRNQGKIAKRERVLSDDELKTIWNALTDDTFSNNVRLLILTGQRRGELIHITVVDDIATIPAARTKNNRDHSFPIGTQAQSLLPARAFNGWGKSKKRLDEMTELENWTIHDLRRTFATNHARLGTPIHIVEKLLNHVSGSLAGVAGIYNRYSYMDEMKEACERYESWLESLGLGVVKT